MFSRVSRRCPPMQSGIEHLRACRLVLNKFKDNTIEGLLLLTSSILCPLAWRYKRLFKLYAINPISLAMSDCPPIYTRTFNVCPLLRDAQSSRSVTIKIAAKFPRSVRSYDQMKYLGRRIRILFASNTNETK